MIHTVERFFKKNMNPCIKCFFNFFLGEKIKTYDLNTVKSRE